MPFEKHVLLCLHLKNDPAVTFSFPNLTNILAGPSCEFKKALWAASDFKFGGSRLRVRHGMRTLFCAGEFGHTHYVIIVCRRVSFSSITWKNTCFSEP